jgi:hypothetical protein
MSERTFVLSVLPHISSHQDSEALTVLLADKKNKKILHSVCISYERDVQLSKSIYTAYKTVPSSFAPCL